MRFVITCKKREIYGNIIVILYVFYSLWNLYPYFTWDTYKNGIFNSIYGIPISSVIFLFLFMFSSLFFILTKRVSVLRIKLALSVIVTGIVLIGVCGLRFNKLISGDWFPFLAISLFLLYPNEIQLKIYNLYKYVICITLIPSIIYYILTLIGFSIPHDILQSYEVAKRGTNDLYIQNGYNIYYLHYPFAVQITTFSGSSSFFSIFRLCGIYDEAGRVGTLCALFLISERLKIKKDWKNMVFLIAGILSFSLSFVLLIVIYYVLYSLFNHKQKNIIGLVLLFICYLIFINLPIEQPIIANVQNRLRITENGLIGDNRTNEAFDLVFANFLRGNPFNILLGHGAGTYGILTQNNASLDASSYKSQIIEYGFLGFALILLWIILIAFILYKRNKVKHQDAIYILIITLEYIINFYQRPSVFYVPYMLIFLGGIIRLCYSNDKKYLPFLLRKQNKN